MRDYFKEKKALADPPQIEQEYQYGLKTLEMLKRQARAELLFMKGWSFKLALYFSVLQTVLNHMYSAPKLVVEPL